MLVGFLQQIHRKITVIVCGRGPPPRAALPRPLIVLLNNFKRTFTHLRHSPYCFPSTAPISVIFFVCLLTCIFYFLHQWLGLPPPVSRRMTRCPHCLLECMTWSAIQQRGGGAGLAAPAPGRASSCHRQHGGAWTAQWLQRGGSKQRNAEPSGEVSVLTMQKTLKGEQRKNGGGGGKRLQFLFRSSNVLLFENLLAYVQLYCLNIQLFIL